MMKRILLLLMTVCSFQTFAQPNRWFGMEGADSTRWGWNLPFGKVDALRFPSDTNASQLLWLAYVPTDTFDIKADGYYVVFNGYWISQTEVTQGQWKFIMGESNPCWRELNDSLPATVSSPQEATLFCQKLDSIYRMGFRLPTPKEWLFAARGGHLSEDYLYAGSNTAEMVAWNQSNSNGALHLVGQKVPNEIGLYDMSGNACELTYSEYEQEYKWMNDHVGTACVPLRHSAKKFQNQTFENVGFRVVYPYLSHFLDNSK